MTLDQHPQDDNFDDPAFNAHPAAWGTMVHPSDDTWQRRDAQAVSSHQVHFTAEDDFVEELIADHARNWITDRIVRLSITTRPATLDECDGRRGMPGGDRLSTWDAKHVECSYLARGQLVKLSRFCGVANEEQTRAQSMEQTAHTAETVLEVLHKLQAALAKLSGLDVRGGGLYVEAGNWRAAPDQTIAAPPKVSCATCGAAIHFANDQWRDADARPDVLVDAGVSTRTGKALKRLDHIHDPEVKGRMV